MREFIYHKFERFTRGTPLTVTGWLLVIILVTVPLLLGCGYAGYQVNTELIELQSKTNGMEHTDNWKQLHKSEGKE